MQTVYYYEERPLEFSKSLFLAGPSPRSSDVESWRPEVLDILYQKEYDGVVYVPEFRNGVHPPADYKDAPFWEHRMIDASDMVLFWIPRDLEKLPGFDTNVEFGMLADSGKSILGSPPSADKMRYLNFLAKKHHIPNHKTIESAIREALQSIGSGAFRTGGETEMPLHIWRLKAFQNWYRAQINAGNRLDGSKVEWLSRVKNHPEAIFAFAIRPNVYIASENRNKINDPVVSRLDISSIVMYKPAVEIMDTEIVLIREFRTAGSTQDGFVWELPGGSSPHITDPLLVAIEEAKEEVDIDIKSHRFKYISSRQMAATLSAHKSHTYAVPLTSEEMIWIKSQKGIPKGSDMDTNPTGERAYTEVVTLREILDKNLVDWSNLGMITSTLIK